MGNLLGPKYSRGYREVVDLWRWSVREVLLNPELNVDKCVGLGETIISADYATLSNDDNILSSTAAYRPTVSLMLPLQVCRTP